MTRARGLQAAGVVAVLAAAVAFPQVFTNPAVTTYGVFAMIFAAVASAWNTFSGFSGYISLGHAVFFGSGAYTLGIAARDWHIGGVGVFALLPLAAAVGALIAVPFGLQLRAIRDDEDRARGLGVRAMRVKLSAFVLSAAITGLVGGVWFYFIGQVEPNTGFDPLFDLSIVLMAFLGGLGTVAGPVLGALLIEPGQLYLTTVFTNGYLSEILLGVLFLAIVLFMPRGVIPTGAEWLTRLRTRGRPAVAPAPAAAAPAAAQEAKTS